MNRRPRVRRGVKRGMYGREATRSKWPSSVETPQSRWGAASHDRHLPAVRCDVPIAWWENGAVRQRCSTPLAGGCCPWHGARQNVCCPWCGATVALDESDDLEIHRMTYAPEHDCPMSGLSPQRAQDRTDSAFIHHAATGE